MEGIQAAEQSPGGMMGKKARRRQNRRIRRKDKQHGYTQDPKRNPKKVGHGPN